MLQEKTKGNLDRRTKRSSSTTCSTSCACASSRRSRARSASSNPERVADHLPRHRHVARRADDRLRLRAPAARPTRATAAAPLDLHRDRRRQRLLVDAGPDLRAQALRARHPRASTRSCSRTATPITSSGSTTCGASTRCSGGRWPATATPRRSTTSARCSATSSIRRRRRAAACRSSRLFAIAGPVLHRRPGDRAGADPARRAADSRAAPRRRSPT